MASLQGQAGFQGSLGCVQAQGHLLHALCAQLEEFLGEFPHLAKAEPSSSNTCSKALCCSKIASSTEGLRSVEPNDIYFWVLGEEKAEKLHHRVLKTPGADWGQKPHHKLCLRLVLNVTERCTLWFCCLICSAFPHRLPLHQLPSPAALSQFWGDPKRISGHKKMV